MSDIFEWQADVEYSYGDKVVYRGIRYEIVQPHRSQSDWSPDLTPALWKRLPREAHERVVVEEKDWHEHEVQQVDISVDEHQTHWYDLDAKRKKELEVGGGLAAGLALLAGGYYAYKHHEKTEEEKKATTWGLQNWLQEAQVRTAEYHRSGRVESGSVTWVLVHGKNFPADAIHGVEESGKITYIARAYQEGGLHPGKAGHHLEKGASISYGGEEIKLDTFEVLVGKQHTIKWSKTVSSYVSIQSFSETVIEGGYEKDKTTLYIARAEFKGETHCGKASVNLDGAAIAVEEKEVIVKEYQVLLKH